MPSKRITKFEATVRAEWPDHADRILGLIQGTVDPEEYPSVQAWIKACYHRPSQHDLIAFALDAEIDACGVEAIFSRRSCTQPYAEYINQGDTYATTLVYLMDRQVWKVTSWGDVVEAAERKGVKFD